MTIDKQEIKALADRVKTDRRFCADEYHHALAEAVLALLAEIDRLQAWRTPLLKEREALIRQRDRLADENEALRKDAERYRWLRQDDVEQCRISTRFNEEHMDAAIDAAMAKEATHG